MLAQVIERNIRLGYAPAIHASIVTYRRVLAEWMGEGLAGLEDLFNSYADVVRQTSSPSISETRGSQDTNLDTDLQILQSIVDESAGQVAHPHHGQMGGSTRETTA